ncbi:stromal cell-derived factor 2-like isoform X1 [Tachypleus tridentatus]|uniref:stromal cell-derived factor 2-like isoform X1 n=1 Tax=Tachypleus tridentatus TaxID=6853 RepID=UPI003FD4C484
MTKTTLFIYEFLVILLILNLVIFSTFCHCGDVHYPYVTCGSIIKIQNISYKVRLHSHDIKYGSGSGQQSVTGIDSQEDNNSHWVVKGKIGQPCSRGQPITCGSVIRLEHIATGKNLHSHHFPSPLSNNLEVSAFGDDGNGDTGDYWMVACSSDYWERDGKIRLKHVDTDGWLTVSGHSFGRPIHGQLEVCTKPNSDSSSYWRTVEGVYIKVQDPPVKLIHQHIEL